MSNKISYLTTEQKIQEEKYDLPYHYFIDRLSFEGCFYFSYLDKCVEIINSFQNKKILDVGCGDGFFLNQLDPYKNNLYGIDYSKRAINFARLLTEGKPINYLISEWENLPFESNYFDIVTSIAVLEHIKPSNVLLCIKETHRVLKNDGLFVLAVPSRNIKKPLKHFQHFNIDDIKKITDQYFEIENIYGRYNKLFPTFYKFFDNRFYEIKPFSKFVIKRLFYKYFASSSVNLAHMLIIILKKR